MRVVLLAALLFLGTQPAHARSVPCWLIRWYVENHTQAEIDAMERKHRVTEEERRRARACLKDKR